MLSNNVELHVLRIQWILYSSAFAVLPLLNSGTSPFLDMASLPFSKVLPHYIKGWSELFETPEEAYDTMPLSNLYTQAESFIAGYKTALAA